MNFVNFKIGNFDKEDDIKFITVKLGDFTYDTKQDYIKFWENIEL